MVLMATRYPWYLFGFLLSQNVPLGVENLEGWWLIQIILLIITRELTWETYVFSSLVCLVFHQVNYQNTWDTKLGFLSQGKTSPSWRGKPTKNSSYRSSNDKYHDQDSDPWPRYASKTLIQLLQPWIFSAPNCLVLHQHWRPWSSPCICL